MSTSNGQAQSDFIIKGLEPLQKHGTQRVLAGLLEQRNWTIMEYAIDPQNKQ